MILFVIRYKAFDIPDGKGFIQFTPATDGFTGMGAHPSTDTGQHIVPSDHIEGLLKLANPGEGDIGLGIDAQWTVGLAQGLAALDDERPPWNGTSPGKSYRFCSVRQGNRARLNAAAAQNTLVRVDICLGGPDLGAEPLGGMLE